MPKEVTAHLGLRIPVALKHDLRMLAARDDRMLGNYVRHILQTHVIKLGAVGSQETEAMVKPPITKPVDPKAGKGGKTVTK